MLKQLLYPKLHVQPFVEWLKGLNEEAAKKGIRKEILVSALTGVKLIPRVVELDRKQPEFSLTFSQYMERVVPNSRVNKGRKKLAENRALLEDKYRESKCFKCFSYSLWVPYKILVLMTFVFPGVCFFMAIAGPICK